jgi:hypothetical protein
MVNRGLEPTDDFAGLDGCRALRKRAVGTGLPGGDSGPDAKIPGRFVETRHSAPDVRRGRVGIVRHLRWRVLEGRW